MIVAVSVNRWHEHCNGRGMSLICQAADGAVTEAGVRIWIVDDNDRIRRTVATAVGAVEPRFCFEREFSSPEGLFEALSQENPPAVILLDIQMGPYCGLDAIRPVRTLAPRTRVLMLTSLGSPQAMARAAREGASDFLLKGCPPVEIRDRILAALSRQAESSMEIRLAAAESVPANAGQALATEVRRNSLASWLGTVALRLLLGADVPKVAEQ